VRILFLTSEYPPYVWGGLGRYSSEAVSALRRLAAVDVLNVPSYYESVVAADDVQAGVSVREEDGRAVVHACSPRTSELFTEHLPDLTAASRAACEATLRPAVDALDPPYDFIYAQDYYTAPFAARLLLDRVGRRLACMSHLPLYAGFTYFDKPHADEVHQALEALCLRLAVVVVVPSRFAKRVLTSIHAVNPDRIVVIGEGVRMPDQQGNGAVGGQGGREALRIFTVARLVEQKGLHFTIQVLGSLRERGVAFEFMIVGRGPLESRFRGLLDREGLRARTTLTREIGHDALLDLYARADVFLSTSLYETFGLTVLEAMSRGCIPIAFRIPALRELIGDAGITVPVGDADAAAEAIEALACTPGRRAHLSALGRLRAAEFSWERHADSLLRILDARA
jgi:glycosyltransferase involved in cell wall biosynthesis